MSLSKEQVKHVANLARLKINEAEAEKYSIELSKVLGYIDQLQEINTAGRQVDVLVGQTNVWRADKAEIWVEDERDLALQQAEVVNNNLVKVPKII